MSKSLFLALIIGSMVLTTAFATGSQEAECIEIVDKIIDMMKDKGTEPTLKVVNSSSGPFRRGTLYGIVIGWDGKMLAHPVNKEQFQIDQFTLKDVNGKFFAKEMAELTKAQGSGWVEYLWLRHGEKEPTLKRTYVKRIPNTEMFAACGYYVEKGK